jgi:hypothetical protein
MRVRYTNWSIVRSSVLLTSTTLSLNEQLQSAEVCVDNCGALML